MCILINIVKNARKLFLLESISLFSMPIFIAYYHIRVNYHVYSTCEYNYTLTKQNILNILYILRSLIFVFINSQIEYR